MLPSNSCSYNFFQPVFSEEMYRNPPVCSDPERRLTSPATATLSWGAGPQPCKWHLEQSPCTRHHAGSLCGALKQACVSFLSRRLGPNAAQRSTVAGLHPSLQDRRTQHGTLQLLPLPPHSCLPAKDEKPFPSPSTKKSPQQTASPSHLGRSDG